MTPNTKIFTDLLRENRAFLTVSAAEYGAGHNAAEAFAFCRIPCSAFSFATAKRSPVRAACCIFTAGAAFRPQHKDNKPFSDLLFLGDLGDGGLFAVSRIDTAIAKRGEMLFLSPGALNFEPMGIDTAEFIR